MERAKATVTIASGIVCSEAASVITTLCSQRRESGVISGVLATFVGRRAEIIGRRGSIVEVRTGGGADAHLRVVFNHREEHLRVHDEIEFASSHRS
jgi:hypothetical protein